MLFTAIVKFPEHEPFMLHAATFTVPSWSELDVLGADAVREAWASIAPGPAPEIVGYEPGSLVYVPNP